MVPDEKTVQVHWYYSVSEWEQFLKQEKKDRKTILLAQSLIIVVLAVVGLYFVAYLSLVLSLVVGIVPGLLYGGISYCQHHHACKWKDARMPEITIMNGIAMINGSQIVFNGGGKHLRKIDITEDHNINILAITYEWKKGERSNFEELKVPVPKGKLKEAVSLVSSLS